MKKYMPDENFELNHTLFKFFKSEDMIEIDYNDKLT